MSTDEQELSSLLRDGHIDHKLRLAVGQGVPPIEAVRMATLNAAASMGVDADYGAVAPGRLASLVLVDDLARFTPLLVLSRGAVSAESGVYALDVKANDYQRYTGTVNVGRKITAADFKLPLPDGRATVRVIGVTEGSLLTEELVEEILVADGSIADLQGLAKIAVIDRYTGGDYAATGLVRGLGLQRGAMAATVNPGVMNLLVLGVDDDDMILAANRVVAMDGGISVCRNGEVIAEVALPIFGILSEDDLTRTGERCLAIESAIHEALGSPFDGLLTAAGFACLAVSIPSLKICDRGLVRVSRTSQEPVELHVHDNGG
jgi:adenine deaminase